MPYIFEIHRGRATVHGPCAGRARETPHPPTPLPQRNYWSTVGVIAVIAPPETDRSSNYSKAFSIPLCRLSLPPPPLILLLLHHPPRYEDGWKEGGGDGGWEAAEEGTREKEHKTWKERRGGGGGVRVALLSYQKRSCPFAAIQRTWAVDSLCAKFPGISILC